MANGIEDRQARCYRTVEDDGHTLKELQFVRLESLNLRSVHSETFVTYDDVVHKDPEEESHLAIASTRPCHCRTDSAGSTRQKSTIINPTIKVFELTFFF